MGLQYSGDDLNTLKESIINSMEDMNEMSGSIIGKAMAAFQDPSWTGQTASRFSSYFEMVYLPAAAELYMLNSCLKTYLNTYYLNYTGYVDADHHAVIYTAETDQLSEDLTGRDTEAETIHTAVETQIESVRDIIDEIPFDDPGIIESVQSVLKEIQDMYDRIDATESKMAADLSEFASACSDLSELMRIGVSATVSADGKTLQLDEQALKGALEKVSAHYDNQTQWMADNAEQVVAAELAAEVDRVSRRGEEAGTVKVIVGIFCTVGSVIVIAATGGAAAPVILCGAASGALVKGVNNAADQYTEKGWDGICWLEVGEETGIGFVVGTVTSGVGYELSTMVTTAASYAPIIQNGLHSTHKATQILTYGMVGMQSTVVSGIGSRAAGSIVYQMLENGEVDFGVVLNTSFSPENIVTDATFGFGSGTYTGIRHATSKTIPLKEYTDKNGKAKWQTLPDGSQGNGYEIDPETGKEIIKSGVIYVGEDKRRFGHLGGEFFTDIDTKKIDCALPYDLDLLDSHHIKFIQTVDSEYGNIGEQPFFGSQGHGNGLQDRVPSRYGGYMKVIDMIDNGIAVEIPDGAYGPYGESLNVNNINTVIKENED